jgi:hypothetical protein
MILKTSRIITIFGAPLNICGSDKVCEIEEYFEEQGFEAYYIDDIWSTIRYVCGKDGLWEVEEYFKENGFDID